MWLCSVVNLEVGGPVRVPVPANTYFGFSGAGPLRSTPKISVTMPHLERGGGFRKFGEMSRTGLDARDEAGVELLIEDDAG